LLCCVSNISVIGKGLREGDVGKLTKTGLTKDLWQGFEPNVTAIMTCKEGYRRGYSYQYYGKTNWSSWDLNYKPVESNQPWIDLAPNGLKAVLHNRNVSDPVMIGLEGSDVLNIYCLSPDPKKFQIYLKDLFLGFLLFDCWS